MANLKQMREIAQEFPLWRKRLMDAGLYATAQAMQAPQDLLAREIERAMDKKQQAPRTKE